MVVTLTDGQLQPTVQLIDPNNAVIGTATAAAGQNALIQATATTGTTTGTYQIVVGGSAGTTGNYTVQVTLNAAVEAEGVIAGATDNTIATAQNIDSSFTTLLTVASTAQAAGRRRPDGRADELFGRLTPYAFEASAKPGPSSISCTARTTITRRSRSGSPSRSTPRPTPACTSASTVCSRLEAALPNIQC